MEGLKTSKYTNISNYVEFLDIEDNYGKKPIEIALEGMNIFVILYMLIVNKIKVSPTIVEKICKIPCILDVNRASIYYAIKKMNIFGSAIQKWIDSSNFMNIFV